VLLLGETGTGKELAARALHAASRRPGPLVAENCAALPLGLVESELFGSSRGAFTGAERDREGLLRAAHRGTLFLDEVGDMPASVQAKLLRVLQEGEVRPLGNARAFHVDLRVVSATSRDIAEAGLRDDLLYRLAAVTVRIPALRERRGDLPLLARHFLSEVLGSERRFTREALQALGRYDWPGNVRQLRFEVERAAALATGPRIGVQALSEDVLAPAAEEEESIGAERRMIEAALRAAGGRKARAAAAIGWTRQKLYRRMEVLGIRTDFGQPRTPRDH
jgi:DNA-binding NtrC family response regulator